MAVETSSDLASFFDEDEHGVAATYILAAGGSTSINGIYEDDFLAVEAGIKVPVAMSDPRFMCRSSDLPSGAAEGDSMTINGALHEVRVIQPDGTGVTTIILDKD